MPDRVVDESGTPSAGDEENGPNADSTPARPSDHVAPTLGFFERLRHHKVAQWTLAYAAGAYTLLHAIEMISGALGWPHLVVRLTTLVLLLGVPVVVTLAWFHGYRGRQRVSGTELAVLTVLFAAAGGVLWLLGRPDGAASAPTHASVAHLPAEASTGSVPSIAVLPFENRSQVEEDAFFVVGIHDDILDRLSRLSTVKVISNTSVQQYRDASLPSRVIAEQLGVRHLLEGGVQRGGSRVRIQLRLIDGVTDANVWSDSYDRELTAENIFAIQTEVAGAVAAVLDATLNNAGHSAVQRVPTTNMEAWENYQRGRQALDRQTTDGLDQAKQFLRTAVEIDPTFASAQAYLAISQLLWTVGEGSQRPSVDAALPAVQAALRVDPELPEALTALGMVRDAQGEAKEAERLYRRVIALNPNYPLAYSQLVRKLVETNEAVSLAKTLVQLDPRSATARISLGLALFGVENWREAVPAFLEAIQLDPSNPWPYDWLSRMRALGQDRFAEGVLLSRKAMDLDPGHPRSTADLAHYYAQLGEDERARQLFETGLQRWPHSLLMTKGAIFFYMSLGEFETAYAIAQQVQVHGSPRNARDADILLALRNWELGKGNPIAAREWYRKNYPEWFAFPIPPVGSDDSSLAVATDLAFVLTQTSERDMANRLVERVQSQVIQRSLERRRQRGASKQEMENVDFMSAVMEDPQFFYASVFILQGDNAGALQFLRQAALDGWREGWRYYRNYEPSLAPIRDTPEFKAIFADIERDMARQREELRQLPEDAPPNLTLE